MNGKKGFHKTPEEHATEVRRRYDLNDSGALAFGDAKEWVFCFAPFLEDFEPERIPSPVSLASSEGDCHWSDPGSESEESEVESEDSEVENSVESSDEESSEVENTPSYSDSGSSIVSTPSTEI